MDELSPEITRSEIISVFEDRDDSGEPLLMSEVGEAIGCEPEAVTPLLDKLIETSEIRSKPIGGDARIWWLSRPDHGSSADPSIVHPTPTLSGAERTVLERILEASPVSIVVVDPSGEITFANERAEETLGLERNEITSRTYQQPEWKIYYDDGTPVSINEHPITRVLESKKPDYGFEHWIELPDGTERWLSSNSAPVLNDDGEVEYVVVGFEDTTRLKDREDKLTSDKRRFLELCSDQLFRPLLDMADGDIRIDVDEVVRLQDGSVLQYLTASGISAKDLIDVFEREYGVDDIRLLQSSNDNCRIEVHVESPTVSLIFSDFGGQVRSLVEKEDNKAPVLSGEVPGDVEPRTVIQATREVYSDIRLEAQELRYSPRLLYDIVEDALTDKQFGALQTAYFGGYFDTPRTSTGDELAERLSITRQTFNQHLRKAEDIVFEQLFEASGKAAR